MPKPRPAPAALRPLNARQRRFVDGILEGESPSAAAIAAGYTGWASAQSAYELARRPNVAAAIAQGLARQGQTLTREAAIEELARVAMSNVLDYTVLRSGHIEPDLTRIDRARAAGVRELVVEERFNQKTGETLRTVRVRMGPKLAALRSLIPLLPTAAEVRGPAVSGRDRPLIPSLPDPDGALMEP
jgi:hypothetical protein